MIAATAAEIWDKLVSHISAADPRRPASIQTRHGICHAVPAGHVRFALSYRRNNWAKGRKHDCSLRLAQRAAVMMISTL
jgi:hypothetical protein